MTFNGADSEPNYPQLPPPSEDHWTQMVIRLLDAHGLTSHATIYRTSPSQTHITVSGNGSRRAEPYAQSIVTLLAGTGPTAEKVDQDPPHRHTIVIPGTPFIITWTELPAQTQTSGAGPAGSQTGAGTAIQPTQRSAA